MPALFLHSIRTPGLAKCFPVSVACEIKALFLSTLTFNKIPKECSSHTLSPKEVEVIQKMSYESGRCAGNYVSIYIFMGVGLSALVKYR